MLELAALTLFTAMTVPGVVVAVRALPPIEREVDELKKPWACDICMCFWSTAILVLFAAMVLWRADVLLVAGPAYPLSMVYLRFVQAPPIPPPPAE